MLEQATLAAALHTIEKLRSCRLTTAVAESCTGGLLSAALTHHAGSSDVVLGGFITYSNVMKHRLLDVPMELFDRVGAVSCEVADAMARGALLKSGADISVSITGIAGPSGGSEDKPVGLVWMGAARDGRVGKTEHQVFAGDRAEIRAQAVLRALALLEELA